MAHRALAPFQQWGAPPKALIAGIMNNHYRDIILQTARELLVPQFENYNITMYPEYSHMAQGRCKTFLAVKKKLHEMNLKYMLLYSEEFRVLADGKSHFFEHLEEV
ncbi:hypothetical protein NDU88_006004 [Pleurodeles waltl]|uniref:Uncharacterized protein n=1 Tax=Pleurodeles waltl TaxID=8319 RepID=A0AAV7SNB0_PLEWA|nr:hypothetical protein NDU88_006004 [Pleurodeles waltl]